MGCSPPHPRKKAGYDWQNLNRYELGKSETMQSNDLLDLMVATKESAPPAVRARVIRLQAKSAAQAVIFRDPSNLILKPLHLVAGPGVKPLVLAQNSSLTECLDAAVDFIGKWRFKTSAR